MIKHIQLSLVAATLCLGSVSSFAGLTLCGVNNAKIDVQCAGNWSPASIPANGCASFFGSSNLDWNVIAAGIMHATSGVCNFVSNKGAANQTTIGSANISVDTATDTGNLNNIVYDTAHYTVDTGSYTQGSDAKDVKITITQN